MLPALTFATALVVIGWQAWRPVFWVDEYLTQQATARSWPGLFGWIAGTDPAPGPYYIVLKLWSYASLDPFWLRVPSILAMAGAVTVLAVLAQRLAGSAAGYFAAAAVAGHADRLPARPGEPALRLRHPRDGGRGRGLGAGRRAPGIAAAPGLVRTGGGRHGPGPPLHVVHARRTRPGLPAARPGVRLESRSGGRSGPPRSPWWPSARTSSSICATRRAHPPTGR